MVVNAAVELTEDEEELYDRQIRLWGLESQKRLRAARVLVVGMNGLGAEVVKDVILSGVKSLTMLDDSVVSELDHHSQFLIPVEAIGKNRAEASLERAQALNPLVSVTADPGSVTSKPDEYFVPWEVIVVTGINSAQIIRINTICRQNSIMFFVGDVFGLFGYSFNDLQSHEFVEEITIPVKKPIVTPGAERATKFRLESVSTTRKRRIEFPSYDDAMEVDFSSEEHLPKLSKMDPSYFIMKGRFFCFCFFTSDRRRSCSPITLDSNSIPPASCACYPGLYIDNIVTWNPHTPLKRTDLN
ncbi:hypothetical protein AAG570_013417 [Ranatra chinensis]|uniref:SUMO-activating enzyme subunit 1 n=1 Tax=Ranatra chinensis TaxID=642074 RepID=A0ABD0YC45_9HEMI